MQVSLSVLSPERKVSFRRMESRADRIKHVRTTYELSQEEFAAELGVTRGAVGNWELGKGIKTDSLAKISERFPVRVDWLMHNRGKKPGRDPNWRRAEPGEPKRVPLGGEFETDDEEPDTPRRAVSSDGRHNLAVDEIPQVEARLGMGHAADAETVNIPAGDGTVAAVPVIDTWRIPRNVLQRRLRGSLSSLHIVECEGDSMEPRIHDGDFVFIDTSRRVPSPPGIFALNDGFSQTLKRLDLVPNSEPPRVRIIPENPRHPTDERLLEEVRIIGRYLCRLTMD
jgi:transcriptional regulator with XRE-family HTH domain